MPDIVGHLVDIHQYQKNQFSTYGGQYWFLVESLILGFILCFRLIPYTTDLMVNASAGLAAKYFGNKRSHTGNQRQH